MDYFQYQRRLTTQVIIGNTPMGSDYPIRLQSMTNTSTLDTQASVEQCVKIIEAGGEYVRLTAQGVKEAENLQHIAHSLRSKGYDTPLVADIHFNPKAADEAALHVDKVRINPGNYVDSAKLFEHIEYSEASYAQELKRIEERFLPFLQKCTENQTAIRIGVNHGSLSDRIMSRYGDTPAGMVESCMEFLRICKQANFTNVVISIKASNTVVMVHTVRLLADTMEKENLHFPLHLGVTEAGDGEDGRIKSAFGIGALLADGLGDTIRVSLSEEPEVEIPIAQKIADYGVDRRLHSKLEAATFDGFNYLSPTRRATHAVGTFGNEQLPMVIANRIKMPLTFHSELIPDYVYVGNAVPAESKGVKLLINHEKWRGEPNTYPCFSALELEQLMACEAPILFLFLSFYSMPADLLSTLKQKSNIVLISYNTHTHKVAEHRALAHWLQRSECSHPLILSLTYQESNLEELQIKAASDAGPLLIDGFCDGIMLTNHASMEPQVIDAVSFGILQAGRLRISKTEYISCPGCGRTLFNLQQTIARVKAATSHLKGLKIGIMGCIVNGPGEMADADYGYVGAGRGKISLYKRKECIEKNIPEEQAVERLIDIIRQNGEYYEA